ncbi:hypothetical protein B484DRAFT_429772 [Ochromonadaceae sp. CCMP2298]|nr:hypothetical protein B484DRAFT_429772 [Ochromonadaceae sp. CCMP2298]|mmetsp:Transcript_30723/g.67865  ORF Transcript_30723/g.67865 Transcript_30723/m.67865 type:complete len:204 (+) Transcript_30723:133-744(+)
MRIVATLSLLLLVLFAVLASASGKATTARKFSFLHKATVKKQHSPKKSTKDAVAVKISLRDVGTVVKRTPVAALRALKTSVKSFTSSCMVLIPVGLVMNINKPKPIDAWIMRGAATGIEWAKIGAYFVGGEVLCANLRNKDDRMNAFLGSGLTSALLRIDEGPLGMAQGFAIGFGFMFAIEQFIVDEPAVHGTATSKHGTSKH